MRWPCGLRPGGRVTWTGSARNDLPPRWRRTWPPERKANNLMPTASQRTRILAVASEIILVEGAGGLMSPLGEDHYVADLAEEFGFPLVVVSRNVLGTINQTLQTLIAAAAFRGGSSPHWRSTLRAVSANGTVPFSHRRTFRGGRGPERCLTSCG